MKLSDFKDVHNRINKKEYLDFYSKIINDLQDKSWLGTFSNKDIEKILHNGGKIWMWYDNKEFVCSMMYMNSTKNTLEKFKIQGINQSKIGECGAIFVNKKYRGNNLQAQMLEVLEEYAKSINKEYILTTIHPDNIYSINNFVKLNYKYINSFELNRGKRNLYIKELK